jgi:hypothetical protein
MGFFLFLAGRGFFPRHATESCIRTQAGKWLIVACALWRGLCDQQLWLQASLSIGIDWML